MDGKCASEKSPFGHDAVVVEHDQHPGVRTGPAVTAVQAGAKKKTVHNADLFAAVVEDPIQVWSKESRHLYLAILVAFCCSCANGYDGSLMTAIIAMPHFQNVFRTGETGHQVSLLFSLYTVGSMAGAPFAAILSDRQGRLRTMFSGAVAIIAGMVVVSSASSVAQFVVGRFVLGLGIAFMTVAAPAYAMEIAPPHWRGRCAGFYNIGWFGGSIPAAAVTYACNYIDSDLSWRIPLILQAFTCFVVMASVAFLPESPRFHMANGRESEATDFLVRYHGNGKSDSRLVRLEMEEMRDTIRQDGIDKTKFDYRPLFMTHNGRWRFAQVVMISVFGQFSGNGLGYFNTVIFGQLGIKSVQQQLAYNLLNAFLSAVGALAAVALTDRMHRRKVLVGGTLACACALAANAGLSAEIDARGTAVSSAVARAGLAAYLLFNVIFSFTYTPLQAVIPTEALETTTRAKGLAASGVLVGAVSFVNQFAGPIALQNIGYRYIYVFVGWDVLETVMWYLFGVESQGRTLEQLQWVYDQPNPVAASLRLDSVIVRPDGVVTQTGGGRSHDAAVV